MSHEVYADGMEIAGKSGANKSIARFPDVCMSPPSPPAGPLPVPYPATSLSGDLKEGSQTVKLGGESAALAQESYYQPSTLGNEAATRAWGMNVVTHQITGKTFFQAWSMDVKIEGKNACRHQDITTSNHASGGTTTVPAMSLEEQAAMIAAGQCPCCGGAVHSAAQAANNRVTADEWYGSNHVGTRPRRHERAAFELAAVARELARSEGCENSLPDEDPTNPCSAHYYISGPEGRQARLDYEAQARASTTAAYFRGRYGRKIAKKVRRQGEQIRKAMAAGAASIAHKTALAAGGCPIGRGNQAPVSQTCRDIENALGGAQGSIAEYHRRALGLPL
jgi:hypothetical protein